MNHGIVRGRLALLSQRLQDARANGYTSAPGAIPANWLDQIKRAANRDAANLPPPTASSFSHTPTNNKVVEMPIETLAAIKKEVDNCVSCPLHETRTNTVFGAGNKKARLLFIGEAPGAEEDKQGEPFVGRAGQLLTKMIEAMGFQREEIYIANILKCRPPGNRDPLPSEVEQCEQYLKRQIAQINPEVICALGRIAAQTLLQTTTPIGKLRGEFHQYENIPLLATYHPAYLLRNPPAKPEAWADLQKVMEKLGMPGPKTGGVK